MHRILGVFSQARAIPAIILFFAVQHRVGVWPAALLATLYVLAYLVFALRSGRATRLDYGMLLFWLAGLAALSLDYIPYFTTSFTTFLYLALFLAAFVPMVLGAEPFTLPFARRKTPPELWRTDQFLAINRIMSSCWSGLFLCAAGFTLLPTFWFKIVIPLALMLGIGIPLNRYFPEYYLKRQQRPKGQGLPAVDATGDQAEHFPPEKQVMGNRRNDLERQDIAQRLGRIRKAMVIFGSPRGEKGYTSQLLDRFLDGLREGGVECEVVSLAGKKIRPCRGCFTCWTKTPGVCIHQDDMREIMARMRKADLIIYAQPLYVFSVPGITKNFLDRLLPQLQPYLVEDEMGQTKHPLRWQDNPGRMCIFSVCGFPEASHFQPMLDMFRAMSANSGAAIVGEILRPASESLLFGKRQGEHYEQLLADLHEAGLRLARAGYVPWELETRISRPLYCNMAGFRQIANVAWDTMLEYETKIRQGEQLASRNEYLLDHPRLVFGGMASLFDPAKAGGLHGTIQFELTDRNRDCYALELTAEGCTCREGKSDRQPDLTIRTPWPVWRAISDGEISGQEAYRLGQYTAQGDLSLLLKLREATA